jgi:S1-C subfamily serine protease
MSTLKQLSDAMADAVQAVSPALVQVNGRDRMPSTGMVWSDGLIVTSHHALEQDENIRISTHDGSTHEAALLGRDPQNDIALLKVNAALTPAAWAASDTLRVGNLVLALGRPGAQVQATLGVVSALVQEAVKAERHGRRGGRMVQVLVDGYIQTDVVMYPGFSGGALVSGDGTIHGMNTSGFGRGASITVPVKTLRSTVEALQQHGRIRRGYLGVGVQPVRLPEQVSDRMKQSVGLLVVSVESGSPAHQSGLLVGDILATFDGDTLENLDDLLAALVGERVGKPVAVQIVRGGELKTLQVTLGESS